MRSTTCTLFNIQRFSTEDGPGIRTTLFFKGCPLRCPWCHNPEGLGAGPEVAWQSALCLHCGECAAACRRGAIHLTDGRVETDDELCERCGRCADACPAQARELVGREYGLDELLDEVGRDRAFYAASGGGVTLSGGEPLMQIGFIKAFAPRCRAEGYHVALDTCGVANASEFESLLDWVDLVLFDVKAIDPDAHRRMTGTGLDGVLANLDRVVSRGVRLWVRTPVIPGFTDAEENLRGIAAHLKARAPTLERYELLAFSDLCGSKYEMLASPFALRQTDLLSRRTMEDLARAVRSEGIETVAWSGPTRIEARESAS